MQSLLYEEKMYFWSFLKVNSHCKFSSLFVFLIVTALVVHRFIGRPSVAQSSETSQKAVGKEIQNNTNNKKMMQKKE